MKKSYRLWVSALCLVAVGLIAPQISSAATLSLSPAAISVRAGDAVTERVYVASTDQPLNAVSAKITFPSSLLTVASVSKSNSALTLWVQEPAFSNENGTVSFSGLIPNPGYTGGAVTILTIQFLAKKTGTALISFDTATVLANDGSGTDILTATSPASIAIEAAKVPPAIQAQKAPAATSTTATVISPIINAIKDITTQDALIISGNAYRAVLVRVALSSGTGYIGSQTVRADASGNFGLTWKDRLPVGIYTLTAVSQADSGEVSGTSTPQVFSVREPVLVALWQLILNYLSFALIILLLLTWFAFFIWYLWHQFHRLRRRVIHRSQQAHRVLHTQFRELKNSISEEVSTLKDLKSKRDLTAEEQRLLGRLSALIDKAEDSIQDEFDATLSSVEKDS